MQPQPADAHHRVTYQVHPEEDEARELDEEGDVRRVVVRREDEQEAHRLGLAAAGVVGLRAEELDNLQSE